MKFGTLAFVLLLTLIGLGALLVQSIHLANDLSRYKNEQIALEMQIIDLQNALTQAQSDASEAQNLVLAHEQDALLLQDALENEKALRGSLAIENVQLRGQITHCSAVDLAPRTNGIQKKLTVNRTRPEPRLLASTTSEIETVILRALVLVFIAVLLSIMALLIVIAIERFKNRNRPQTPVKIQQAYLRPIGNGRRSQAARKIRKGGDLQGIIRS